MPGSYRFGRFEVRPSQRSVLVDGATAPLGARAFDLLWALIERRDRIVGSAELFELVWPGVVVEENNVRQQIAALRRVLGADALLTVPGRGYRLAWPADDEAAAPASPAPAAEPARPSIAVLPFVVLSPDSRLTFLAEGLAEDVIALLARVPGFLLISRQSTFAFGQRSESIAAIARELGVRYVVEGSVRAVGSRVRVSTQLAEAASGRVLWTGRFDEEADAAADLQESIARGILSELEPELARAEMALVRRHRPSDVDAWSHYRQAAASVALKGWTEESLDDAFGHFRAALAIDPSFALARAHLAVITALGYNTGLFTPSPQGSAAAAEDAEQALALGDGDSQVLGFSGCALADLGQHERGAAILQRALVLDPSNAQAHVALGATLALRRDNDAAIARMRHGMRISPRDRRLAFWGWFLGLTLLRAGRPDEALEEARISAERDARLFLSPLLEAAVLQSLGRDDQARGALATARRLRPALTLEQIAASHGAGVARRLEPLWAR